MNKGNRFSKEVFYNFRNSRKSNLSRFINYRKYKDYYWESDTKINCVLNRIITYTVFCKIYPFKMKGK